jgi:aspartyl-tRNA(Asn)/glutamyl-tRNA(Gln) amidotransferase subunit C
MSIPREEVARIAALARLTLPEERLDRLAAELSRVLEFVAALDRLELEGLAPSVLTPTHAWRTDVVNGERLAREQAIAMAPATADGAFLVPPIVEYLEP